VSDDPSITEIYWAPHDREVRLVEITSSIADKGEVLPFRFTPDPSDVPYQSVIVLLSLGDWRRRKELEWPNGFEKLEPLFTHLATDRAWAEG
jgi:hypothetical protein